MDWLQQIVDSVSIGTLAGQFHSEMQQPTFWLAVGKIIWINILLSGDNALVIALACRALNKRQRMWGMVLGAGIAVLLRIIFTGIVATLLELPYLKLVGGLILIVIAAKLLVPDDEDENSVKAAAHLWRAVQIVVVADIVMSLDNVIAVAAAANGSVPLLILGLAISVPLIVAGAALILLVLNRLPILVWAGAALLGWIAGDIMATDPAVHPWLQRLLDGKIGIDLDLNSSLFGVAKHLAGFENLGEFTLSLAGAIVVLSVGTLWRRAKQREVAADAARIDPA